MMRRALFRFLFTVEGDEPTPAHEVDA